MTPYFKVKIGYGVEDFISISKDELEKATYAFITNDKVVFQNGVTTGKAIMAIVPDYHKTMGWNYGRKMEDLDFAEVKAKVGDPVKYIALAKENVQAYINAGTPELIGSKPLEIKAPSKASQEILENVEMKSLVAGMKI
jgi:hypothetical protein